MAVPGGNHWLSALQDTSEALAQSNQYPDPFFSDWSSFSLPQDVRTSFEWAAHFWTADPIIGPIQRKRASYVVTSLVYQNEDQDLVRLWRDLFDVRLKIKSKLKAISNHKSAFNNAFVSLDFGRKKLLSCQKCKHAKTIDAWEYRLTSLLDFEIKCPKCGAREIALVKEMEIRRAANIRVILWDPSRIEIRPTGLGDYEYYLDIPASLKALILAGDKKTLETAPQDFINAARTGRKIKFSRDGVYHLRGETLDAAKWPGWGVPAIFPAFKSAYMLQTIRKANEVTAREFIHPTRILHPATNDTKTGQMPGYGGPQMDPQDFVDFAAKMFQRKRRDPTEPFVAPYPIGLQQFGGEGRSLFMMQEYRAAAELTAVACGVPQEFLFGGLTYSGSSVSMRMLENEFITDHDDLNGFLDWAQKRIAWVMDWPVISIKQADFKMADDLARVGMKAQLAGQGKYATDGVLQHLGTTFAEQQPLLVEEARLESDLHMRRQIEAARAQARAQSVMAREQMDFQQAHGGAPAEQAPEQGGEGPPPPEQMAAQIAEQVPPEQWGAALEQLQEQGAPPEYLQAVQGALEQMQPPGQGGEAGPPPPEEMAAQIAGQLPPEEWEGALMQLQEQGAPPEYLQAVQAALQQQLPPEQGAEGELPPPEQMAQQLMELPPDQQEAMFQQLEQQAPPEYMDAVMQAGQQLAAQGGASQGVDDAEEMPTPKELAEQLLELDEGSRVAELQRIGAEAPREYTLKLLQALTAVHSRHMLTGARAADEADAGAAQAVPAPAMVEPMAPPMQEAPPEMAAPAPPAQRQLPPPEETAQHFSTVQGAEQNMMLAHLHSQVPAEYFQAVLDALARIGQQEAAPVEEEMPSQQELESVAAQISAMPQAEREQALSSIQRTEAPEVAEAILAIVRTMTGTQPGAPSSSPGASVMRPPPEIRPPRRGPETSPI